MNELALYAFNQALVLSPNTRIKLRRVNPMFSQGGTQGTFSFPFQLPKKPNMQLLGFSQDPQVTEPITTITDGVRLEYAGESMTGSLRIDDAGSFFECQFLADNGDAAVKLQNVKLQDLAFANEFQSIATAGGQQNRSRNLARAINEGIWPMWPYVVYPFYNPRYFNGNDRASGYFIANKFLQRSEDGFGALRPKVTGDAGPPILLVITNQVGDFIDGEVVTNGTLFGLAAPNASKEPNRLVVAEPTGGGWGASVITGTISGATADVNSTNLNAPWVAGYWHCPAVFVFAVFEGIAKELGYNFITELVTDQELLGLTLLTGKAINNEVETTHGAGNPTYLALLPDGFYLKDFLPGMSVSEFLQEFKDFWGWVSYFDQQNQRFTITPLRSLLNAPPDADWTTAASQTYNKEVPENHRQAVFLTQSSDTADTLATMRTIYGRRIVSSTVTPPGGYRPGDIEQLADGRWYEYVQNLAGGFTYAPFSFDLGEQAVGAGIPAIRQSKLGIAPMKDDVQVDYERQTRMPFFGSIGGMNGFELSADQSALCRLIFYRGTYTIPGEAEEENDEPYASSDEFDAELADAYKYSLKFSGPKGRFNLWLADYIDFTRNTFLVKRRINLPPGQLLSFDLTKKKVIEGTHYFVKHIDITLPYRQPAEAELYKY